MEAGAPPRAIEFKERKGCLKALENKRNVMMSVALLFVVALTIVARINVRE
jgi:hypothetical protein